MSTQIVRISGELPKAAKLALSAIAAVAMTAQAVEFENDVIEGNFDTTLSYGGSFRTTGPDLGYIGRASRPRGERFRWRAAPASNRRRPGPRGTLEPPTWWRLRPRRRRARA